MLLLCLFVVEIFIDPDTGKQILVLRKEVAKTRKNCLLISRNQIHLTMRFA